MPSPTKSPITTAKKPAAKRAPMKRSTGKASLGAPGTAAGELPIGDIAQDVYPNPRGQVLTTGEDWDAFLDTIREQGVMTPVIVGPAIAVGEHAGKHPLVAGHRRFTAARLAGHQSIPVRQVDLADAKAVFIAAIAENVARRDMDPLAEARSLGKLMQDYGLSQVEAGKAIGMSVRTVRSRMQILALPEDAQLAVDERLLPMDAVPTLIALGAHRPDLVTLALEKIRAGELQTTDITDRYLFLDETLNTLEQESGRQLHQISPGLHVNASLFTEHPLLEALLEIWPQYQPLPTVATDLLGAAEEAGKLLTLEWPAGYGTSPCRFIPDTEWLAATLRELITAAAGGLPAPASEPELADEPVHEQSQIEVPKTAKAKPAEKPDAKARRQAEARGIEIAAHADRANHELARALGVLKPVPLKGHDADLVVVMALDLKSPVATEIVDYLITPRSLEVESYEARHLAAKELIEQANTPTARAALVISTYVAKALHDARGGRSRVYRREPMVPAVVDHGIRIITELYKTQLPQRSLDWLTELRRLVALETEATLADARDIDPAGMPPALVGAPGPPDKAELERFAGKKPTTKNLQDAIQLAPGVTIPELAAAFGIAQNTLYRVLPTMMGEKLVTKIGRGWHPVGGAK